MSQPARDDSCCRTCGADAAPEPPEPPGPRLVSVRVERVCAELEQLGADERVLALWGRMSPALVRAVLRDGRANRATLRRLKRALRLAWTDRVGVGADRDAWARITMRYLSDELA